MIRRMMTGFEVTREINMKQEVEHALRGHCIQRCSGFLYRGCTPKTIEFFIYMGTRTTELQREADRALDREV